MNGRSELFEHRRQCKGPGKEFYCQGDRCSFHIWVCKHHAARNEDKMKTYMKNMESFKTGSWRAPRLSSIQMSSDEILLAKKVSKLDGGFDVGDLEDLEAPERLEYEDDVRELHTNLAVSGGKLDYPKYSGEERSAVATNGGNGPSE